MQNKTHYLKTIAPYFEDVNTFNKQFECRYNDKDFQIGDIVYLEEYDANTKEYTGREIKIKIKYILDKFEGLKDGWIIFGFVRLK